MQFAFAAFASPFALFAVEVFVLPQSTQRTAKVRGQSRKLHQFQQSSLVTAELCR
jgi:hypothetical protein